VNGVVINNIEGHRYVRAKTFIDATGDAVLADLCGVPCREAGRDTQNIMPGTLCSLCAGFEWERIRGDVPGAAKRIHDEPLKKALADGHFSQPNRFLPGMLQVGHSLGNLNGGHIFDLNALRCSSLTEGMMQGRRLAYEYTEFYRKYVPGFEKLEHATTASLMGVRESRRIVGEYELTFDDDFRTRREFPDQIGVYNKPIDIHHYSTADKDYEEFIKVFMNEGKPAPGERLGIPYGILVPKGWSNLWVAGRAVSADVEVHGSLRVQPFASVMGQAAGTAAVQSIKTGQPAYDLDTRMLVETLRDHRAYLPQKNLSKTMTR
jgi:hypothetical protein